MYWIKKLEEYFENIAPKLQSEVRLFLDEYYEKKDTHSADILTFETLSDDALSNLLYLQLSSTNKEKINLLTQKISLCKNLKILDIDLQIENIDFLKNLSELRILKIFSTQISEYKNQFSKLKKLVVFSFAENINKLDLSEDINKMNNLVSLGLTGQNIQKFPKLENYSYLIDLDLWNNQINEIPTSIGNLRNLKTLCLTSNKITSLPKELFELPNLESLHFDSNNIDYLPNDIFFQSNLKDVKFSHNPYNDSPRIKMISELIVEASVDSENEKDFFQLLKTLNKASINPDYNYVTLKIPKSLQTPMLQYIEFFRDYVVATKGEEIIFEVKREEEGLVLVTNGNSNVTLPQLGSYFEEYVSLTQQKSEDWVFNFEGPTTALQADILRLKMENEIGRLKNAFQIAKLESQHLSNQLSDKNAENQFLKNLSDSLSHKIDLLLVGKTAESLNVNQLLLDIQNQAVKMLERKHSHRLENLHNDVLTDFLRQRGYQVTDQTRSGRSKLRVGEIDIMIRKKDGTPFSIIETFRLKSCGKDNKIVATHLDKLLHDYDTAGHERNFVIVYAEAKKFEYLWKNYKHYINELNGKSTFRAEYPLIKFEEKIEISDKSSIKIGLATHRREGSHVEVYHIFINMFV